MSVTSKARSAVLPKCTAVQPPHPSLPSTQPAAPRVCWGAGAGPRAPHCVLPASKQQWSGVDLVCKVSSCEALGSAASFTLACLPA